MINIAPSYIYIAVAKWRPAVKIMATPSFDKEDFEKYLESDGEQAASLVSSSPRTSGNPARFCNNSHHSRVRRSSDEREEDLFLEENSPMDVDWHLDFHEGCLAQQPSNLGRCDEMASSNSTGELEQSLVEAFGQLSLQCPYTLIPQQECGRFLSTEASFSNRGVDLEGKNPWKGDLAVKGFSGHAEVKHEQQTRVVICLFKRGIIARDELEHALYIFPFDQMPKIYPKIKKNEALVDHGTEFPLGEEHETMRKCSLHQHIVITGNLNISFQMVDGQFFSISSPTSSTAITLSEISAKCEERIAPGFSLKVLVKCIGGTDHLYQDQIRLMLHSGNATLHLIFPIAHYEASVFPWFYEGETLIPMPQEDRRALRACHVELLDNIGDVLSLCQHLYQHKIIDGDDLDEICSITKKSQRNAHVLRTLQTRGNVLDFVIQIMQTQRENQGAAVILQKMRCEAAARMKKK